MLNNLLANLASAGKNLHVSVPMILAIVCEAGKIWAPRYEQQFDATQKILIAYGVISAGNSVPTVASQANTIPQVATPPTQPKP